MPLDGRTRCKLCGADHRLSEPHRFPDEPMPRVVQAPPIVRHAPAPVPAPAPIVPAAAPHPPVDASREARAWVLAAAACRAYRARRKAQYGTTTNPTNAERQRRYRERQKAAAR
jgi:hypothetical protein